MTERRAIGRHEQLSVSGRDASEHGIPAPIRALARDSAARLGLRGCAEDLAQAVYAEAWMRGEDPATPGSPRAAPRDEPFDLGWAEERALEMATEELARRRRAAAALRNMARAGDGDLAGEGDRRSHRQPSPLCPGLSWLAGRGRTGGEPDGLVLFASLQAVRQGALRMGHGDRLSAFLCAYVLGSPVEDVASMLRLTPRAVVETLRRASSALECRLLGVLRLRLDVPPSEAAAIPGRVRRSLALFATRSAEFSTGNRALSL